MKTVINAFGIAAIFMLSTSCGGGGNGNNNTASSTSKAASSAIAVVPVESVSVSSSTSVSFNPDRNLLNQTAENSDSLYVDKDFAFDVIQKHTLLITVHNSDSSTAAFKQVFVYSIPQDLEFFTDEDLLQANLLLVANTDSAGMLYQVVEWPGHVKKIAVKVDAFGIETQAVINVENEQLAYDFH